jgi:hypothetical protein
MAREKPEEHQVRREHRNVCAEHPQSFADLGKLLRRPLAAAANPLRHAERA